jgi:hypothetical protein
VRYLEKQLDAISDPLLREKILGLISNEIEKGMVVSKEAFKIVDPVYLYKSNKAMRLYTVVFGFGVFCLSCLVIVFIHALSSSKNTEEDRQLLAKIKKEIFLA